MKTAAIYCRVSTEDQEREGTSLDSQRNACLKKAKELGFEVPEAFIVVETYSGLSLERPKLDQLRQWVRDQKVNIVIAYTLDRLSRDPVHCIILQDEFERSMVELSLVTETIDTSDMGKLITHIKGFAAKLEAEKIRERTQRGIRERVKAGRMPSGRRARLFGYTYVPGKGPGEGIRRENEAESKWVKQIFNWFVNDGLGIDRIAYKLREVDVRTPSGKGFWHASEVWNILKNRAYAGETYVFTQTYGLPKHRMAKGSKTKKTGLIMKPREEWVEIPNATPQIIDKRLFELAQLQLKRNRERSSRNRKQEYLLSGHLKCKRCNRSYWGYVKRVKWGGKVHPKRYYRCAGKLQMVAPERCDNHILNAEKIEAGIWNEVERLLTNPRLILCELEKRRQENQQDNASEQLKDVRKSLAALEKEQQQLLQWALKGFPEETIIRENDRLNSLRTGLEQRAGELAGRVEAVAQGEFDMTRVEEFCRLAAENLHSFTYEDKRLALEALHILAYVDADNISLTGTIPMEIDNTSSSLSA